jgi:hypothetical protein
MLSACWIADSAASVGSFIFFGLLAISVVASRVTPAQDGPISYKEPSA